jgi:hypothetical protein
MAVHLGSLPWPKPPQFSGGSLLRPKPFAVLRVGPLPGRGLSDCPVDRCFDRSLRSFPVDRRLDRNPPGSPEERRLGRSLLIFPFWRPPRPKSLAGLPDPGLGRSPCRSPLGSPRPAEALAVHLSGNSVSAEADRSFPAGKNVSRSWHPFRFGCPSKPKPWRLASEAPCRPRPIGFYRSGSPSEPKLFRFSFGGSVKPKLLVPPGCSTKLADPCKS